MSVNAAGGPDPFYGAGPTPLGPYVNGFAITPSDNAILTTFARELYIGTSGNLQVILRNDTQPITLIGVPVGFVKLWVKCVFATGTTAANIIGFN